MRLIATTNLVIEGRVHPPGTEFEGEQQHLDRGVAAKPGSAEAKALQAAQKVAEDEGAEAAAEA